MLELRNIKKAFGDCVANEDVSITVKTATIHAIVGENGAGKSTIMKIAYGFYKADSGEILVNGQPVNIRNPHDAIALGIGMVHQHFMLVDTMTVAENIILGAETGSTASLDLETANREILALSNELKLDVDPRAGVLVDPAVGLARDDDRAGQLAERRGVEADVEEPRSGDVDLGHALGRAQPLGDRLGLGAGARAGLLRQLQGDVGGVVAV
ncbi:MAG TPA: ATP-binding cassette domain-containing protein, partial [Pyrinomonadaceae bacterium]|nr:ATP-binding cassette domain-containing protein [Pyrinomonadaceae bacterium]